MVTTDSKQLPPRVKDERGKIYSKLTVVRFAGIDLNHQALWLCRCKCGNTATVSGINLRKENTKSCGCLHYSQNGGTGTPEYEAWKGMKRRCCNPRRSDYYLYGGRGITVCQRWLNSFVNFLADMGEKPSPKHSIDRIDNDGNYEPGNCRWATPLEQSHNSRRVRLITHDGMTLCLNEWSRKTGISDATIFFRLRRGWPVKQALTTPAIPPNMSGARMLTYNGETLSIRGWARKLGIFHSTIARRLKKGWPVERAITAPVSYYH